MSQLADQWAARFAQADSANHVSALARAMRNQQIHFVMIHLDGIGQSRLKTTSSAVSPAAAQRLHPLTQRADSRACGALVRFGCLANCHRAHVAAPGPAGRRVSAQ